MPMEVAAWFRLLRPFAVRRLFDGMVEIPESDFSIGT